MRLLRRLACVDITYMRVSSVCAMMRVRACRCVLACVWRAGTTTLSFVVYLALLAAAVLPHHVCITPSLKLSSSLLCEIHGTTAVAQQGCVDHHYAFVDSAHVNACRSEYGMIRVRAYRCVWICLLACWNPTFQRFAFVALFAAAAATAAV